MVRLGSPALRDQSLEKRSSYNRARRATCIQSSCRAHAIVVALCGRGKSRPAHAELKASLKQRMTKHSVIGDVQGLVLFIGVELVRDRATLEPAAKLASHIVDRAKHDGIRLSTDGPLHNVLKIKPPLPFSRASAD